MRFFSSIIKQALYFSAEMHDGQLRKGGKVPYIVHPVIVAFGVSEYTDDDEIVAAALLHDVLEDCKQVTKEKLHKKFGAHIASLVEEVSFLEPETSGLSWKEKKQRYLNKIEDCSKEALLIIGVDKMANMKTYFEAFNDNPERVSALFKASPEEYRWYYKGVGEVLKRHMEDRPITRDYHSLLDTYKK